MHITFSPPITAYCHPIELHYHYYCNRLTVTLRIIITVYVSNDVSPVTTDPDLEKINVYGGAQFLIITHVSLLAK